jgi:hypothetical protein
MAIHNVFALELVALHRKLRPTVDLPVNYDLSLRFSHVNADVRVVIDLVTERDISAVVYRDRGAVIDLASDLDTSTVVQCHRRLAIDLAFEPHIFIGDKAWRPPGVAIDVPVAR